MSWKNCVGLPTYDVFGNRISEAVTQSGTTTTTLFSYDANNTLYADLNGSGTITTRYISGVGGPDLWLARVDASGSNSAWLLGDYQGTVTNVVAMSDGSRTQLTSDSFGNVTNTSYFDGSGSSATSGPEVGMLGFQGGMTDAYTGYVHFGSQGGRDYDPTEQRWLQQDSLGLSAGPNPYEAMGNAPTNYTDPTGMAPITMNGIEYYQGTQRSYSPVLALPGGGVNNRWVEAPENIREAVNDTATTKGPFIQRINGEVVDVQPNDYRSIYDVKYKQSMEFQWDNTLGAWYQSYQGGSGYSFKAQGKPSDKQQFSEEALAPLPPSWSHLAGEIGTMLQNGQFPGLPKDADAYQRGFLAGALYAANGDYEKIKNLDFSFLERGGKAVGNAFSWGVNHVWDYGETLAQGKIDVVTRSAQSEFNNILRGADEGAAARGLSNQLITLDYSLGFKDGNNWYRQVQFGAVLASLSKLKNISKEAVVDLLKADQRLKKLDPAELEKLGESLAKAKTEDARRKLLQEAESTIPKSRQRNGKRRQYLGQNPKKTSSTYQDVVDRMREEGKIVGEGAEAKVRTSSGEWIPLKDAELSHTKDAVKWWNEEGRLTGPKSEAVREFMTDAENYVLDKPRLNRSAGAKLGENYLPPPPPAPPSPPIPPPPTTP